MYYTGALFQMVDRSQPSNIGNNFMELIRQIFVLNVLNSYYRCNIHIIYTTVVLNHAKSSNCSNFF